MRNRTITRNTAGRHNSAGARMILGLALVAGLGLAGCAGQSSDPAPDAEAEATGGWSFWSLLAPPEQGAERVEAIPQRAVDQRPLVAEVAEVMLEPVRGGAILRVRGRADAPGWFEIALVRADLDDPQPGQLRYRLVGLPPASPIIASGPNARDVVVARYIAAKTLAGVRDITVQGETNSRKLTPR